jgi:hypothetical protein
MPLPRLIPARAMRGAIIATRVFRPRHLDLSPAASPVIVIAPMLWSRRPDRHNYCSTNDLEIVSVICTNLFGPRDPNFRQD